MDLLTKSSTSISGAMRCPNAANEATPPKKWDILKEMLIDWFENPPRHPETN